MNQIKSLNEIEQELIDNDWESISKDSFDDLGWHLQTDEDPWDVISLTTDALLIDHAPLLAKHLDHEDGFTRAHAVGCLVGRLRCAEYAEKALHMALNDPKTNVRNLSISSLGAVINKTNKQLQKKIAEFLLQKLNQVPENDFDKFDQESAYESIIKALDYPPSKWPEVGSNPTPDPKTIEEFKKKFGI